MAVVRSPQAGSAVASARRDERVDFLRGLALLIIFIDHVPQNVIEPFTLHAYAFADAAEVFFFISGYVAALVYGRTLVRKGFFAATARVLRRAGVVYAAQLVLLAFILFEIHCFMTTNGDPALTAPFRAWQFFDHPGAVLWQGLLLRFQPAFLDILPAYVLLLLAFPLVLAGLARNVWLVLVPSFALWLWVQFTGFNLTITTGERWFFNPFAWQFLFVLGAVFGHPATKGRMAFLDSRLLFWAAAGVTAVIAVVQFSNVLCQSLPFVPSLLPDGVPLDKSPLQPLRIVSLLAMAVVVARVFPERARFLQGRWARLVVWCGQSSLQVFSFGALLSSFTLFTAYVSGQNPWLQTLVCLIGIGLTFAFAATLHWRRSDGRLLPAVARHGVAMQAVMRERVWHDPPSRPGRDG